MSAVAYRSFLVRTWERELAPLRVSVEDVQTGQRLEVRGALARHALDVLDAALAVGPVGGRPASACVRLDDPSAEALGGNAIVLVVGATGMVGYEVCRRLVAQGMPVRALVRTASSPAKVDALRALGVKTVVGDLRAGPSLAAACAGVTSVITTVSSMPFSYEAGANDIATTDLEGTRRLVDAAVTAGAERFIYTSFSGNIDVDMPLGHAKRAIEDHVRASGLAYTILRPSYLMEVWLSTAVGFDPANAKATVFGDGTAPISWIALGDVAECAVRCLAAPEGVNAVLELGGPESLSPLEVVAIFERVGGRPFEIGHVDEAALVAQEAGATDSMARSFATLMRCYARGDAIAMDSVLTRIPMSLTSVRDYAERVLGPVNAVGSGESAR